MKAIKTSIKRPVTVSMFVVAVILFGLVSLDRLALNLLPDISYPSLTIQTDYPDAAPEEIESLVTRPIEESVGVVPGLTRISSTSRSGQSEVILEFTWDTRMDLAALDVREKLDFVTLPRDAEKPVILRFDPSFDPIQRVRLYGDLSLSRLRYAAEKELQKDLESTEGVAAVKVIGGLEEQIRIEIDEQRLAELGIPITEVTSVLAQENLNQATGSLYDRDANYLVRMLNQFRSVEEIRKIIVRSTEGRRVLLEDVARVWRGTKERDIIARLNGKESVELAVYKEGDANTVTVARAVERKLNALKESGLFPQGVEYEVVFNQADFIESAVDNVLSAAILGGILATLVLFLFLRDLRSTITIGFSIPISIMATFALMYQTDITLNIMSLGGVALGVGMLVDNSIVVLEAVDRYRKKGIRLDEAVYRGTSEVGKAVVASTLTTVAVFLPLVFVEGIAGQLFRDQALTITYALLASLLVALTVIPMFLALRLKRPQEMDAQASDEADRPEARPGRLRRLLRFLLVTVTGTVAGDVRRLLSFLGRLLRRILDPLLNLFHWGFDGLSARYPRVLTFSLNNKGLVLTCTLALILVAAALSLQLGAELIPPLTQGEFSFQVELPKGSPLHHTDQVLTSLEEKVAEYPEVSVVYSSVGGSNENQFAQESEEENMGQLYVALHDREDKQVEQQVIRRIRDELKGYPEVEFTFRRPTLFSFKTPIEVEVYGFDLDSLRRASDTLVAEMEGIQGLSDIRSSTELGNPEVHIRFDREKLARLGLDEGQVVNVLRNKIRGDVATRYREEDKQIDVLVQAQEGARQTVGDLRDLTVNVSSRPSNVAGGMTQAQVPDRAETGMVPIRLGAVAEIDISRGPSEIRRIRNQRAAVISANLTGRDLSSVSQEIRQKIDEVKPELPVNVTVTLGGQNEELQASYNSLFFALGLAIFLVYLVMASQFESLVHPFIIMFSVPLGLIGVVFALWAAGINVSVMVFLGVIILAGIVVNNAIVLIDYTNQLRAEGLNKREALLEAGQVRLRPIVMTTMTTVLGLIPMGLGWGEGAEVRGPMAITVMGGLLFSTLLTLIFIPVVYELVDRKVYQADAAASRLDEGQDAEPLSPGGLQPAR
ncbi:MAG TPA: efflux RND transporter permease subunit [Acidobacteriota bacterium]|nr:efflux RND transporter permease subunit [Acidobacteriota bacterium]